MAGPDPAIHAVPPRTNWPSKLMLRHGMDRPVKPGDDVKNGQSIAIEVTVQPHNLCNEIIEPPVGRGQLLQRPDEQRARAARPQEEREMREIAALREGACDVVQGMSAEIFASSPISGRGTNS